MGNGFIRARYLKRPPKSRPFDNILAEFRSFSGEQTCLCVTPDEAVLLAVHLLIAVMGSQKDDPAYRSRYVEPREALAAALAKGRTVKLPPTKAHVAKAAAEVMRARRRR